MFPKWVIPVPDGGPDLSVTVHWYLPLDEFWAVAERLTVTQPRTFYEDGGNTARLDSEGEDIDFLTFRTTVDGADVIVFGRERDSAHVEATVSVA